MSNVRVAVVIEDDDDMRHLVKAVLVQAGFEVHAAASGHEGIETVRSKRPVVVTVDVGLPDIDGFEVLRQIRKFSTAYILMVTGRTEEADVVTALDCGADDYIGKPFRPWEVQSKIGAMLRRPRSHEDAVQPGTSMGSGTAPRVRGSDGVLQHNGLTLDVRNRTASVDGSVLELTRSEFDLLYELLRGAGAIRTKSDLVRAIRGDHTQDEHPEADQRALEAHIGNLRRKLGETANAPRLLLTVRGLGYRLTPEPKRTRS